MKVGNFATEKNMQLSINIKLTWGVNLKRLFRKKRLKRVNNIDNLTEEHVGREQRFQVLAQAVISRMERVRSRSTIENYGTALRSFLMFAGNDVTIDDIDDYKIACYQRWLADRGVKQNTCSCYMRTLRSLMGQIDCKDDYKSRFKNVFTGNARTAKRAISEDDIRRLMGLRLSGKQEYVRDLFIFSFYAMGMPFVDLAFLKQSQLKDGYIEYERHKTGQRVRVKIEEPMQRIINRYARESTDYLFPILCSDDAPTAMREYKHALSLYNQNLQRLSKRAGLPHVASYVARHTWASIAYKQNVDLPVISKALGHTNTETTLTYIREIADSRVEEANSSVIQNITELLTVE